MGIKLFQGVGKKMNHQKATYLNNLEKNTSSIYYIKTPSYRNKDVSLITKIIKIC